MWVDGLDYYRKISKSIIITKARWSNVFRNRHWAKERYRKLFGEMSGGL